VKKAIIDPNGCRADQLDLAGIADPRRGLVQPHSDRNVNELIGILANF